MIPRAVGIGLGLDTVWWGITLLTLEEVLPSVLISTIYGYSREREKSADIHGLDTLIASGYEPREMEKVFQLLGEQGYEQPPLFYSTHPKLEERRAYVWAFRCNLFVRHICRRLAFDLLR